MSMIASSNLLLFLDKFLMSHRSGHGQFIIQHYAGSVQYSTSSFVVRNKDRLYQGEEMILKIYIVDCVTS
jgi:myosin heavy subunit